MGDISDHFNRSEFKCFCCDFDTVDVATLKILEDIRRHFNAPITITSGCRCETYNKTVGGKKNSQHLRGRAADIQVEGHSPIEVKEYAEYIMHDWGGIGLYIAKGFVHIDTKSGARRRWTG